MKRLECLFAGLVVGLLPLGAAANCDKPINAFDDLYCHNKVYIEADRELNERYKELVGLLDAEGKKALRTTQIRWIRARDAECSRHEDGGFFVNIGCAADTTIVQADFLQARIRECKSSGCLNSRL